MHKRALDPMFALALLNAIPLWRGARRKKGWTGRGKKSKHAENKLLE